MNRLILTLAIPLLFLAVDAKALDQCRVDSCQGGAYYLGSYLCVYVGASSKRVGPKLSNPIQLMYYLKDNDGIVCDADIRRINETIKAGGWEEFREEGMAAVERAQRQRRASRDPAPAARADDLTKCRQQLSSMSQLVDQLRQSSHGLSPSVQHQIEDLQNSISQDSTLDAR